MSENATLASGQAPLSVFVTAADSPLGLSVVRALVRQGYQVTGATRNGTVGGALIRAVGALPTYTDLQREADVRSSLLMTKASIVVDLSSASVNQLPYSKITPEVATLDTVPLLNASHTVGIQKFIYVGFVGAYGDTGSALVDESAPLSKENEVFRALNRAENVLLHSDLNVVVLRGGVIYGGDASSLHALTTPLKAGRPIVDGAGVTSFVHLEDLTAAVVMALQAETLPSRVYNIVDDQPASFDTFAATFSTALGIGAPLHVPVLGMLGVSGWQATLLHQSTRVNNARAKAELGWAPLYRHHADGIERMLLLWRAADAPLALASVAESSALVKA